MFKHVIEKLKAELNKDQKGAKMEMIITGHSHCFAWRSIYPASCECNQLRAKFPEYMA
jgi:UDP-2,3-diacylglucosamine pyrophosphatase LpxH